jgi:diguanylate cyclase (GGDEF)-like protein
VLISYPDPVALLIVEPRSAMASESQLSEVLSDFARTMVTDFPIQSILDHLVKRIVEIMPVTAAGVTLISPGVDPRYIAASSEAALQFEKLQTELGEGPCLEAYNTGEAISVPDLSSEDRFPAFVARARDIGLVAVFTFPLRLNDRRIGALDLYRDKRGKLSAASMKAAQTLADVTTAYIVNAEGRADLSEASYRSRELSLHDALTGLPNRLLLMERLEHALLRARRSGLASAVLFVDLDRFKVINDSFGHRVGDEVLVAVGARLSEVLRPGDTLSRVSGDEFVVLCEDLASSDQADVIVGRLEGALEQPFFLSGIEVNVTASIGTAFTGKGGPYAPEDVLHAADMAMYRAKQAGGGRHEVLDLRDKYLAAYQAGLERDLHGLLGRSELHLHYQPIVSTGDGHITGVEALLRWAHPNRGMVMPGVLLPLAERAGMMAPIGRWVLQEASAERDHWQHDFHVDDVSVAVNVSAHLLMSVGFVDMVAAVLSASDSPADQLTLEMTESVFVSDGDRALIVLKELKNLGVNLALDDFGTGYSSLSYLLQFPVDIVKIDQIFVARLGRDQANQAIVASVIQLAHALGATVVAEGVETVEQHQELVRLGADFCQGFYFAHPMPAVNIDALIEHRLDGSNQALPKLAAL